MNIILVSATKKEISPILNKYGYNFKINNNNIDIVISGISIVNTLYSLLKLNLRKYDIIINAGIAGSFNKNLNLLECVISVKEYLYNLGIEDNDNFIPINKSNILDKNDLLNNLPLQITLPEINILDNYKKVTGLTSNISHGNEKSISKIKEIYPVDIETMESAALFFISLKENIPLIPIRSISNYVEKRNIKNWEIENSIKSLNKELLKIINSL